MAWAPDDTAIVSPRPIPPSHRLSEHAQLWAPQVASCQRMRPLATTLNAFRPGGWVNTCVNKLAPASDEALGIGAGNVALPSFVFGFAGSQSTP